MYVNVVYCRTAIICSMSNLLVLLDSPQIFISSACEVKCTVYTQMTLCQSEVKWSIFPCSWESLKFTLNLITLQFIRSSNKEHCFNEKSKSFRLNSECLSYVFIVWFSLLNFFSLAFLLRLVSLEFSLFIHNARPRTLSSSIPSQMDDWYPVYIQYPLSWIHLELGLNAVQ